MAIKVNNIQYFYGDGYGHVKLVKRSIGRYRGKFSYYHVGNKFIEPGKEIEYWRGQLVADFRGHRPETGEVWDLRKGQLIWLDASIFSMLTSVDFFYMLLQQHGKA